MNQKEREELDQLKGQEIAAIGYDHKEAEWYFVFPNGRRLTLSAGEDAYFHLSRRLQ